MYINLHSRTFIYKTIQPFYYTLVFILGYILLLLLFFVICFALYALIAYKPVQDYVVKFIKGGG